jgi:hypothetical protein
MTESKPETLEFRRTPDGVEITFLKPPLWRRSRKRLVIYVVVAGLVTLFAAAPPLALLLYGESPSVTVVFPLVYLFAGLGAVASEINWDRDVGVLRVSGGLLVVIPSPGATPREWKTAELAGVRACPTGKDWELQIELAKGQVFRASLAAGRPRAEVPSGSCPSCGDVLGERTVSCTACGKPQHVECWMLQGACSTEGCGETRPVRSA